jgi:carbonic anhydrase
MLGLAETDVDMIRNFGTVIDDDAIRSLVSTRLLGTREIMIINHTDCGMLRFTDAEKNTTEQIQRARSHTWISQDVPIRGFVYDVNTGRLSEVFPDEETATAE